MFAISSVSMMIFILLGVLFFQSTALASIKTAQSYWTLKPNVIVVNVEMGEDKNLVPIICGEAYEGQNVTWIKNEKEILEDHGNNIMIEVDGWRGDNYSCTDKNGSYLNHTLVLAQWNFRKIIKNNPQKGYIHCSTNKYGGSFQCFWTWDEDRDGHAFVAHVKAVRPHGGSNISCSLDSSQSITCLDQDYCPYSEEVERISLTIYFRSSFALEAYNTKFYIMDIVRPDIVNVRRINQTSVKVAYPDSWNTPSSYFPLIFQVKEILCQKKEKCDCSKLNSPQTYRTQSVQLAVKEKMTVCVRAMDEFCNSSWSEWSKCGNRRNRNRGKHRKLKKL